MWWEWRRFPKPQAFSLTSYRAALIHTELGYIFTLAGKLLLSEIQKASNNFKEDKI